MLKTLHIAMDAQNRGFAAAEVHIRRARLHGERKKRGNIHCHE
jgi:hypothetical protein